MEREIALDVPSCQEILPECVPEALGERGRLPCVLVALLEGVGKLLPEALVTVEEPARPPKKLRQVANAVPEGDGAGVFADIVAVHQAYAPRALPAGTLVEDKVRRLGVQVESSCLVCGADEPSAFAVEVADVSA